MDSLPAGEGSSFRLPQRYRICRAPLFMGVCEASRDSQSPVGSKTVLARARP